MEVKYGKLSRLQIVIFCLLVVFSVAKCKEKKWNRYIDEGSCQVGDPLCKSKNEPAVFDMEEDDEMSFDELLLSNKNDECLFGSVITVNGSAYAAIKLAGKGGVGSVCAVKDLQTGKRKAIKIIDKSRFETEPSSKILSEIDIHLMVNHLPGVVHLYEWERKGSKWFMVMEYAPYFFADLFNPLMVSQKRLNSTVTRHLWKEILRVVDDLHYSGVVHLDIKLESLVLTMDGKVKIADFGSGIILDRAKAYETNALAKTPHFTAPEVYKESENFAVDSAACQLLADAKTEIEILTIKASLNTDWSKCQRKTQIGAPADIWQLGQTLYQMMYGKRVLEPLLIALGQSPYVYLPQNERTAAIRRAILDPFYEVDFPDYDDKLLKKMVMDCLMFRPQDRPTIPHLLDAL